MEQRSCDPPEGESKEQRSCNPPEGESEEQSSENRHSLSEETKCRLEPRSNLRRDWASIRSRPSNSEESGNRSTPAPPFRGTMNRGSRKSAVSVNIPRSERFVNGNDVRREGVETLPEGNVSLLTRCMSTALPLLRLPPSPRKSVKPKQLLLRPILPKENLLKQLANQRSQHRPPHLTPPKENQTRTTGFVTPAVHPLPIHLPKKTGRFGMDSPRPWTTSRPIRQQILSTLCIRFDSLPVSRSWPVVNLPFCPVQSKPSRPDVVPTCLVHLDE